MRQHVLDLALQLAAALAPCGAGPKATFSKIVRLREERVALEDGV